MLVLLRRADFGLFRVLWEEYHGDYPREKKGPGVLDGLQGSAPPSSRMVHPNEQQMEHRWLETSTDEQAAPG